MSMNGKVAGSERGLFNTVRNKPFVCTSTQHVRWAKRALQRVRRRRARQMLREESQN